VRNTFLNVTYFDAFGSANLVGGSTRRRSDSDLAIARLPDLMVAPTTERVMADEFFSLVGKSDAALNPCASESLGEEDSIRSDSSQVWSSQDSSNMESTSKRRRRRELRPCKGKRERYNKFFESLTQQIDANPFSFDFGSISWPPSLADDVGSREKTIAKLKTYESSRQKQSLSAPQMSTQTQGTLVLSLQHSITWESHEQHHATDVSVPGRWRASWY
jgi:hypothetical protein